MNVTLALLFGKNLQDDSSDLAGSLYQQAKKARKRAMGNGFHSAAEHFLAEMIRDLSTPQSWIELFIGQKLLGLLGYAFKTISTSGLPQKSLLEKSINVLREHKGLQEIYFGEVLLKAPIDLVNPRKLLRLALEGPAFLEAMNSMIVSLAKQEAFKAAARDVLGNALKKALETKGCLTPISAKEIKAGEEIIIFENGVFRRAPQIDMEFDAFVQEVTSQKFARFDRRIFTQAFIENLPIGSPERAFVLSYQKDARNLLGMLQDREFFSKATNLRLDLQKPIFEEYGKLGGPHFLDRDWLDSSLNKVGAEAYAETWHNLSSTLSPELQARYSEILKSLDGQGFPFKLAYAHTSKITMRVESKILEGVDVLAFNRKLAPKIEGLKAGEPNLGVRAMSLAQIEAAPESLFVMAYEGRMGEGLKQASRQAKTVEQLLAEAKEAERLVATAEAAAAQKIPKPGGFGRPPPPLPPEVIEGKYFRSLRGDPDPVGGGYFYTRELRSDVKMNPNDSKYVYELGIKDLVDDYPHLAEKLGVSIDEFGRIRYPDVAGLNARLAKLPNGEVNIRYWSYMSKDGLNWKAPYREFLEHWAEGEVVISAGGPEHFHDLIFGAAHRSYLGLPMEVLAPSRQKAKFLVDLLKDGELSKNVDLMSDLDGWIRNLVDNSIDGASASISNALDITTAERAIENMKLGLSQMAGDSPRAYAWDVIRSIEPNLSPSQLERIKKMASELSNIPITKEILDAAAGKVVYRFGMWKKV
jgi:hypothetical protein